MKKLFFIVVLLIPCRSWAASCSNTNISNGWTCVISTSAAPGVNGGSTSGITTSGSNLLVVMTTEFQGGAGFPCTPSDTVGGQPSGNTWTLAGRTSNVGNVAASIWYVNSQSPVVGATHVATCSGTGIAPVVILIGFKTALPPVGTATGNTSATSTVQVGSITPSTNNGLIITDAGVTGSTAVSSIDSGFTIAENIGGVSGTNVGGAFAYLTQSTAAAVNPTWTLSTITNSAAEITSFNQLAASTGNSSLMLLGIGR